jgi:hypothetical protein
MTGKQALREARKRWGKNAYVEDTGKPNGQYMKHCRVGVLKAFPGLGLAIKEVKGDGDNFIEAFASADKQLRAKLATD